jgi:two-component system, sensor histidine kinase
MSILTTPARTARVLVIEDNMDVADTLARFLHVACGDEVAVAYDGAHGLAAALADRPEVVVCDIALPKRNGLLVGEEIAETVVPRPLLIAVTAHGDERIRSLAADAGFDHFLAKPADPFAIETLIDAHFASLDSAVE